MEPLVRVLAASRYAAYTHQISGVSLKGHTYADLVRATTDQGQSLVIKIRLASAQHVHDSLDALKHLHDPEQVVVPYLDVLSDQDHLYLLMDDILGVQPIDSCRERLPEFFAALGTLNSQNPHPGPYTSMYVDGRRFASVEALVAFEVESCQEAYQGTYSRELLRSWVQKAARSPGCLILEDMHPGNMILEHGTKVRFLDTEHLTAGPAIYQFEHVDVFGLLGDDWFTVNDRDGACASAFFAAAGIPQDEGTDQLRGFAVLQLLRQCAFERWKGVETDFGELDRRVGWVVSGGAE